MLLLALLRGKKGICLSGQILVLLAEKELLGVIWKSFHVIQIGLRDRIMLMSFIFLLNLQRALLSQTLWCSVGIFSSAVQPITEYFSGELQSDL